MRDGIITLVCGSLFGAGLAISGMADPARVRSFLDVFGAWDPTLVFVMVGAIIPMAFAWRVRSILDNPLAAETFYLPDTEKLDIRLIGGAAIFGIGWGVAGLCPGPAVVGIVLRPTDASIFVIAMIVGIAVHRGFSRAGSQVKAKSMKQG